MFINGSTNIVELKPTIQYDIRGGWSKTRTWQGLEASIRQLADTIRVNGLNNSGTIDPSNPPYSNIQIFQSAPDEFFTLVVQYTIDLQYAWTFAVNTIENDITLHPIFQGLILFPPAEDGLPYALKTDRAVSYHILNIGIDLALTKGMPWGSSTVQGLINIPSTAGGVYLLTAIEALAIKNFQAEYAKLSSTQIKTVNDLFRLKNQQVESYQISMPTLRKTTLLPMFTTDFPLYSTWVNSAFTSNGLQTYFSTAKYGVLPTTIKTAMDTLPNVNTASSIRMWIYQGYTIDQMQNAKLQITQEWFYVANADSTLYGTPIT